MPEETNMPLGSQDIFARAMNIKISYKLLVLICLLKVAIFHLNKVLFYLLLAGCFFFSFIACHINSLENVNEFNKYLIKRRKKYSCSGDSIRFESYLSILENEVTLSNSTNSLHKQIDNRFMQKNGVTKPALTGSYIIDDEIHKIIDLIMRDYIDVWYKNEISSRNDFRQTIRFTIHNIIRYLNSCLKDIDWEHFIMNILAQNLVFQMRMFKKAKEKCSKLDPENKVLKNEILKAIKELSDQQAVLSNSINSQSQNVPSEKNKKILINDLLSNSSFLQAAKMAANQNETSLVEFFFDLEAEKEKGICRDEISLNSSDKESEILQEISEIICFSVLPTAEFNCLPLRCLLREILSNHLIKTSVNNLTDPDYINQTILYLWQDQAQPKTDNFLLAIIFSESLDELKELRNKIDEEILKTRSYDKGGQNDQEIKQRLSSLQYIKRKIEACILNLFKINSNKNYQDSAENDRSRQLFQNDQIQINQNLMRLDFRDVCTNQTIQHCFIEYMGKQNVQNLISFYLNADMYRQFAQKELDKNKDTDQTETKLALKDFANGLINSYLLNAVNFTESIHDENDQPVNIVNQNFYKAELIQTVEKLDMIEKLNESLLDDLQAKIFDLMKQKYFPNFKNYPEFQKIIFKNDPVFNLNSTIVTSPDHGYTSKQEFIDISNKFNEEANEEDEYFSSSLHHTGYSDLIIDEDAFSVNDDSPIYDRLSQSSLDTFNINFNSVLKTNNLQQQQQQQNNLKPVDYNFKISAQITSSGVCNELKKTYAIYIIDVTKIYSAAPQQNVYWQTYRRFNDFYDLHLTIKKRFSNLSNLTLPGKNFRNSLTTKFIENRKSELNRYLQTLCNPDTIANNPKLIDLVLQFLENKPWDNSQTNLTRRIDSIFTPMISSVQNIQSSINENVIGMVKGISDNLNPVVNTFSRMNSVTPGSSQNPGSSEQDHGVMNVGRNLSMNSSNNSSITKVQIDKRDLIAIDKAILNNDDMQSNNFPVRVVLMLIDEIFDLKEKNQWIRQSLMTIIKTFMKNFKGDSMNKKIKEQIADLISEEYLARYLKNFRKRIWPKGFLATTTQERSKSIKQVTKVLAKTKLLAIVSDDLRHILGNDTTRRGIFEMFDLFQHKPLNKRLFHIIAENLLANFFLSDNNNRMSVNKLPPPISTPVSVISIKPIPQQVHSHSNLNEMPFIQVIRSHLTKSGRVKPEWKISVRASNLRISEDYGDMIYSTRTSYQSLKGLSDKQICFKAEMKRNQNTDEERRKERLINPQEASQSLQRSRSLHTDISC